MLSGFLEEHVGQVFREGAEGVMHGGPDSERGEALGSPGPVCFQSGPSLDHSPGGILKSGGAGTGMCWGLCHLEAGTTSIPRAFLLLCHSAEASEESLASQPLPVWSLAYLPGAPRPARFPSNKTTNQPVLQTMQMARLGAVNVGATALGQAPA